MDTVMWIKDEAWLMLQNHPTRQEIEKCSQCSWAPAPWNHPDSHRILTESSSSLRTLDLDTPCPKALPGTSDSSCPIQNPARRSWSGVCSGCLGSLRNPSSYPQSLCSCPFPAAARCSHPHVFLPHLHTVKT